MNGVRWPTITRPVGTWAAVLGRGVWPWLGFALVLLVAPWCFSSSLSLTLLSQMGMAIIVCLSYNLLLGQGGMLSFGHAVYVGTGGFCAIHVLNAVSAGWPLPVSLVPLVGGVASVALALLLGWVSTLKSATPFAMITLGLGELVWAVSVMFPSWFGGEAGVSGNRVAGARPWGVSFGPQIEVYHLIALYTFASTALLFAFTRTPLGRMLNAVRDNPERAAFVGYDPHWVRFSAFVVASFFAGMSGALAALNFEMVTTEVFSSHRSGAYLLFTVLGGSTVFFGPIIGAVLMVVCSVWLSVLTPAWLLYLGVAFVAMVMVAPGGVAALLVQLGQAVRRGDPADLWLGRMAWILSAMLGLAGLVVGVEMAYHLQHLDALGPGLLLGRWVLQVNSASTWFGAVFVAITGVGLCALVHRQLTCPQRVRA